MICDCTLSYQSFIISSDFPHDEGKVLPLCTYLTIVIKTQIWFIGGCMRQSFVYLGEF